MMESHFDGWEQCDLPSKTRSNKASLIGGSSQKTESKGIQQSLHRWGPISRDVDKHWNRALNLQLGCFRHKALPPSQFRSPLTYFLNQLESEYRNRPFSPICPCWPRGHIWAGSICPHLAQIPPNLFYPRTCPNVLNAVIIPASTTSSGSSFHTSTTFCLIKLPLMLLLNLSPLTTLCPLVLGFPILG